MRWGRLLAGVVAAAAALVLLLVLGPGAVPDVRLAVRDSGAWAPILFVLLHAVVTITPLPRTVFTVAAGVLFGSVTGVLLALTGTALSALAAFGLVRLVGGRIVARHAHRPGVVWVRARLEHSGLLAMLSLRLIPMVPFALLNYASGLSGVRVAPFLVGTVLGVLPGTVTIVVLGDAAIGGHPPPALLAVSLVSGLLGLAGAALVARRAPQMEPDPDPAA